MRPETVDDSGHDERWGDALADCLEALESGRVIDRTRLLARYPEFVAELRQFFERRDRVERVVAPLRMAVQERPTPVPPDDSPDTDSGGPQRTVTDAAGRSFGDYEILGELGRGGMGTVYKARQRPLNRTVALKFLRPDSSRVDEARFRNEAETVAQFDHPHIVPVYEVGEHGGQLYFTMKLVEGGSLAQHLGRFGADPRAAVALLAPVARAVHYAHQRGVLHRDLKPSNVLLDRDDRGYVADFGLARRLDAGGDLTRSGTLVGTPHYMAPELADHRKGVAMVAADVYGLGAVLYAVLTGRPPFRGQTVLETLDQLKSADPDPPRRLNPRIDRDLETVCLTCLAKDPARRYASAAELADDLERWLAGEPVRARRVGRWERAWKWVRRNPAVAALLAVVVLAGVTLMAGALWSNARLRDAAERERGHAARATRERNAARRAVDDMYTQVAEKWLAHQPRLQPLQREFLEKALRYYQEATETDDDSPKAAGELAEAYLRVGRIQGELGASAKAEEAYRRAVEVVERAGGEEPAGRAALAVAWGRLSGLLIHSGRHADAGEAAQKAITLYEQAAAGQDGPSDRGVLAYYYGSLGQSLEGRGDLAGAEEAFRKALKIREEQAARAQAEPQYQAQLALDLRELARVLFATQRFKLALEVMERGADAAQRAAKGDPGALRYQMDLAGLRLSLAIVYWKSGQLAKAEKSLRGVVEAQTRVVKDYPDVTQYREDLGSAYNILGIVHDDLGRRKEAEAAYRESIRIKEKLTQDVPTNPLYREDLVQSLNNLTPLLLADKRLREAERVNAEARLHAELLVKGVPQSPNFRKDLARSYWGRADIDLAAGRPGKAAAAWKRALEVSDHPDILAGAAEFLASCPDPKYRDVARAVALARKVVGVAPENGGYWATLGLAEYRAGHAREAVRALEQAEHAGDTNADVRLLLAMARWAVGDRERARREYTEAVRLLAQQASPDAHTLGLRDEAAGLLGVRDVPPGPKGKEGPRRTQS
jgi:tetratricopeptide (TPR) repeat protein/tRNA A-37 threonylcarbamoyl transferase component Bud32